MLCLAYIPGEGLHVQMYFEIGCPKSGLVSLWVLIEDEMLEA